MCIKKKKLYKQFVRNNSQENKLLYTKYKNILTSVLRFIQKEYYYNKFSINIFSNVGNNLAKLIINPTINTSIHDTLEKGFLNYGS